MGTVNLVYVETTEMAGPRLNPYLAFSVPAMGNAGLSYLGVFELAAAIQPLRRPTNLVQRLLASERIGELDPERQALTTNYFPGGIGVRDAGIATSCAPTQGKIIGTSRTIQEGFKSLQRSSKQDRSMDDGPPT
jgi:hypothetical protein